ncbi:MAG TPA: hypothetical protein VHJ18_03890 [Streptosporangiaceae bacterium]|jgi:hypothetical protein|nr:hypothetical protein [Streptosporangiaceae bacterium]
MSGLPGAARNAGPVSRLHAVESFNPADFPVPGGREEDWRFTPVRASADRGAIWAGSRVVPSITVERGNPEPVNYRFRDARLIPVIEMTSAASGEAGARRKKSAQAAQLGHRCPPGPLGRSHWRSLSRPGG